MTIEPITFTDKLGREVVLRAAVPEDAADLIQYLKVTSGETPFLIREPDEITITMESEVAFIQSKLDSTRELMLLAFVDGKHVGNCSLMSLAPYKRYQHRCDVAIALYQEYCGCGIGKAMLETVLDIATNLGYEQAELEVVADNGENEITIPVDIDEKVLTGDDLDLAFTEAEKCLDEIVLGENESYNDVCKNLSFPSKVPGTSIELTYETDIPDLIDNYGNVYMENSPEGNVGILVQINIHMKYQKKERIHIIYAYVPPKKK